eukprot:6662204-Pyramimonas_sp.AAC.1
MPTSSTSASEALPGSLPRVPARVQAHVESAPEPAAGSGEALRRTWTAVQELQAGTTTVRLLI